MTFQLHGNIYENRKKVETKTGHGGKAGMGIVNRNNER